MSKVKNVEMIRIDKINILNPRHRSKKIFNDMTDNIMKVGLKRPITVKKGSNVEGKNYDLVCGQGRIESFVLCGQTHIPAIVVMVSEADAFVMSLVENLARRNYRSPDIMHGIKLLQQKGYDAKTIADKTGLTLDYTNAVLFLLDNGEERLLTAVEAGNLPVTVAVTIAASPNNEQKALQEAYESGQLRGSKFIAAKKLLDRRKQFGRALNNTGHSGAAHKNQGSISANDIMRAYRKEVERKVLLVRNAEKANREMLFVVTAMRQLLNEELFYTILKAEGLLTLPKPLSLLVEKK